MVEIIANVKTNLLDLFVRGQWLDFHSYENSKFLASLIAATLWQIWKCRCNFVFRQDKPDILKSAYAVVMQVKEFSMKPNNHKMRCYIMQNRPSPG